MYIKVTDEPNLVRDSKSNAILNVNNDALNKYKQERERFVQIQKVISNHKKGICQSNRFTADIIYETFIMNN